MGLVNSPAFPTSGNPAPAKKTKKDKSAAPVELVIETSTPEECNSEDCQECIEAVD